MSIVVAISILNSSGDIQLSSMTIKRDIGIYIIATISMIVFGFIGELSVASACVMLAEYLFLVLVVYCQESGKKKEEEEGKKKEDE